MEPSIGPDGVYKIGNVSFPISRSSVREAIQTVANMTRKSQEAFIAAHGFTAVGVDADTTSMFAQSLIQNDWYVLLKGEIPVGVKRNAEKREERYRKAAGVHKSEAAAPVATATATEDDRRSGEDRRGAKASRDNGATYKSIMKKADFEKLKPGTARYVVAEVLNDVGSTTRDNLVTEVEKSKKLHLRGQTPISRIVGYHLGELVKAGFATKSA